MLTFSLISRFSFFFFIKKTFYTISLFKFPDGILSCSGALPKTKSLKQRENLSFINTEECYTFETILLFCAWTSCLKPIVIKPGPGIDLVKKPGSWFYGSTRKFTNFSFFWKLLQQLQHLRKLIFPQLCNLPSFSIFSSQVASKATRNAPHCNLIYFLVN